MTVLEMMTALEACGDASVWETEEDGMLCYDVTLQDFDGFDDEWSEVMRDYEDEELVDAFLAALESQALRCEGDFYHTYYFDGFCVQLGYASYDI